MSSIPNPPEPSACETNECRAEEEWRQRQVSNIIDHYEEQFKSELEHRDTDFAPVNGLPVDVLCYIFQLLCLEKPTLRLPPSHICLVPQINLSHVCSLWRQTILSAPSFWRNIKIDMMECLGAKHHTMVTARKVLARARDLPLSLELVFGTDGGAVHRIREEYWYKNLVTELIAPFRFCKLSTFFSSGHLQEFLELPEENLSCIEELRLRCIDPPFRYIFAFPDESFSPLNFKKLTNLTSFRLGPSHENIALSEHSIVTNMPWHQLRCIELGVPTPISMCFNILQNNSVLESCDLVISALLPLVGTDEPIHCPQLRSLRVVSCTGPIDPFLLRLRMPGLKVLALTSLRDFGTRIPISLRSIIKMQDMSKMAIEELSIDHVTDMDVGALLAAISSLRRLLLSAQVILTYNTISKLGKGILAPCLEDLALELKADLDLGKLLRMVKMRCTARETGRVGQKGPTAFKTVKFYSWDQDCYEEMEEIRRYGVQLEVLFPLSTYMDEWEYLSFSNY